MTEIALAGYQCAVCGLPDVMAVAPGTQADASPFAPDVPMDNVVMFPSAPVPTRAWCADHWRQSWTVYPDREARNASSLGR